MAYLALSGPIAFKSPQPTCHHSPSLPSLNDQVFVEYLLCARHWSGLWGDSGRAEGWVPALVEPIPAFRIVSVLLCVCPPALSVSGPVHSAEALGSPRPKGAFEEELLLESEASLPSRCLCAPSKPTAEDSGSSQRLPHCQPLVCFASVQSGLKWLARGFSVTVFK